jgi:hypothetical protein
MHTTFRAEKICIKLLKSQKNGCADAVQVGRNFTHSFLEKYVPNFSFRKNYVHNFSVLAKLCA